jgi:hypothetical protein
MADFNPKFVDLVRNYTTTTGTADFTLGAAVNGFTGFAAACAVGERFYYACIGVDKPAEREIGRGTLLTGGKIQREPVSGAKTSFTAGTKAIALIAAAEHYASAASRVAAVEQSIAAVQDELAAFAGAGIAKAASRAALAAMNAAQSPCLLSEAGREGLFAWADGDQSALVAADLRQGLCVAPESNPTGATGAWVRRFSGPADVRWFGAVGDGVTDDGLAFAEALAALGALAQTISIYAKFLPALSVPAGHYFLGTTTLDLVATTTIRGAGGRGNQASRLRWANGATGIRIQAANTAGATDIKPATHEASHSLIEGLKLEGGYAGTEGEFHGVHLRTAATIRDCMIANWPGDGVHVRASAGSGAPTEGNANLFRLEDVWCHANRNGVYLDGADSNAGLSSGLNCTYNRQAGVFDSSYLGNTHIGPHFEENGISDGCTPCRVTHGGNIYCCIAGQEAGAATNSPSGTSADNDWWAFQQAGGADPARNVRAWASGTAYRAGGPFISDNDPNRRGIAIGMYVEGSQPLCQAYQPNMFLGGTWGTGFTNGSSAYRQVGTGTQRCDFAIDGDFTSRKGFIGPTYIANAPADDAYLYLDNSNSDSNIYFRRNGVLQGRIFSNNYYNRLLIQGGNGLFLGGLGYNGEQVSINAEGMTLNQGAIGYRAGAGGAVVQATSKSTGVTLNKASGQVTMHNASLAAGAAASFTLTNSQIGAADAVIVNIAAGASADSYEVTVSAVAAGSCRVQLRNIAAAALGEAVVLNFAILKGATA